MKKIGKEEIVKISIELFRKQGYNRTSMNDLALACGLHKGSFYHHFHSKEALMKEVLQTLLHYYNTKLFSIAHNKELQPRERMELFFKKQEPIFTSNLHGCLFGNITLETIGVEEEFRTVIHCFFSSWIDAFFQIFFDDGNDQTAALAMAKSSVMEMEGALMLMRVFNDAKILHQACEHIISKFNHINQ